MRHQTKQRGDIFNTDPKHNLVILFFFGSLDAATTYLCINSGLQELNPIIKTLYDIGAMSSSLLTGYFLHLMLYLFISTFIAYAADYLHIIHRRIAHAVLLAFTTMTMLLAINNLTALLIQTKIM